MKVLTQEEEKAHYAAVVRGGLIGGTIAGAVGLAGVLIGTKRYSVIRNLTLPFRSFLVTSSATFGAIVLAERASVDFGKAQHPMSYYKDKSRTALDEAFQNQSATEKSLRWARENRYTIVAGSWVASMATAVAIVNRNKYLTTGQKVVQARVYAQGLTLLVLIVTGLLEAGDARKGKGRWETVMVVDPNDPEHKRLIEEKIHHEEYEGQDLWKDMVAAEERRLATQKKTKNVEATAKENVAAAKSNLKE